MNKTKKISALLLLFVFLSSVFALPARADFWGASMGATTFQITTEKMLKSIEDTLVANLKIAAIRIINGRLSVLLTGSAGQYGGGGGAVISNWQDFIYGTAQRYALAATSDFFTQIRSGIPNTLASRVVGPAQKAVAEGVWNSPPDLQNYVAGGDATKIFSGGTSNPWMAWRMAAMPQNDLAFTYLRAAGLQQAAYQQQSELQKAQAIAGQGYKSVDSSKTRQATASNGKQVTVPAGSDYTGAQSITTPGSTVKSISEEILKMPLSMLNYANTIPQVVTSMVNSMITQVIQSGVNTVTAPIDAQIVKARNQAGQSLGQMQSAVQSGIVNATTSSSSTNSGTKLFK
jgi:hypothetical protein